MIVASSRLPCSFSASSSSSSLLHSLLLPPVTTCTNTVATALSRPLFPLLRRIRAKEVCSAQSTPEMDSLVEQLTHGSAPEQHLVQYIVLRTDLMKDLKWGMGSVISQACHAAVAAIWLYKDDPKTMQYCSPGNLPNMRKVTLEVDGEAQLLKLAQNLENASVLYKLWTEQPENIPTCLATKPYCKNEVAVFFKKLKLFK